MNAVILGAGTAIPAKAHSPSGIYVRAAREHLLLDCGPGTLQRLRDIGVSIFDLDRVFLTHFHLDHCLEALFLLFARRIPTPFRQKPLVLYAPPGLREWYRQLNRTFSGWLTPHGFRLSLHEMKAAERLRLPGYQVQAYPMRHTAAGAFGYRLTEGRKHLAYSGDTEMCDGAVQLGRAADALIVECSTTDERKARGHLTPSDCARLAAVAGARHLVLTHFYPVFAGYDIRRRVRRVFRGRLTIAKDFTAIAV